MTENSAAWKALSDAEKQPYVDRAKAGQVEYKIRRDEYLKTVPRKVLTEINRQRRKRGHQKIRGIGPTRPLQPFMRFSQDIRDEFLAAYTGPPRNAVPASAAAAGIRWRNMSDADKAPYVEAFNREKEAIEAQKEAAVDAS
ncbi:hypothetical protein BC835DRAFT_134339 [Cytidiella melzeri]|nr:hypothetical protein BC835DRAFT_134339 [Cytidiella melzeri]